jgi:hypothetical protein
MGSIHIGHELYGQKPDNNFIFTIFNSTSSSNEPQEGKEGRGNQVEYKIPRQDFWIVYARRSG